MEQINPHCHTNVVNAKYLLYSHFFIPHGGASARDTIIGRRLDKNSFLCGNFFKGTEGSLIFQSLNNLFTVHKYEFFTTPVPSPVT